MALTFNQVAKIVNQRFDRAHSGERNEQYNRARIDETQRLIKANKTKITAFEKAREQYKKATQVLNECGLREYNYDHEDRYALTREAARELEKQIEQDHVDLEKKRQEMLDELILVFASDDMQSALQKFLEELPKA